MKEYAITIGDVEHTVLLDDEDAKARGLKPIETKEAAAPQNKARTTIKKG